MKMLFGVWGHMICSRRRCQSCWDDHFRSLMPFPSLRSIFGIVTEINKILVAVPMNKKKMPFDNLYNVQLPILLGIKVQHIGSLISK